MSRQNPFDKDVVGPLDDVVGPLVDEVLVDEEEAHVLLNSKWAGLVLGKKFATINRLATDAGVSVHLRHKRHYGEKTPCLVFKGSAVAVKAAVVLAHASIKSVKQFYKQQQSQLPQQEQRQPHQQQRPRQQQRQQQLRQQQQQLPQQQQQRQLWLRQQPQLPQQQQRLPQHQQQRQLRQQQQQPQQHQSGDIHVFVDQRNVHLGAQNTIKGHDHTVRVNFAKLTQLVEAGRSVGTRLVGGSKSPGAQADPSWVPLWKKLGYSVRCPERPPSGELVGDYFRDILDRLLSHRSNPQTLVLLSGDGGLPGAQTRGVGTHFPTCCKRVLDAGWKVEVWSWSRSLNSVYRQLQQQFPSRLKLRPLDDFPHITFRAG